eukprot:2890323-Pyramimonas_sp.AAC.1
MVGLNDSFRTAMQGHVHLNFPLILYDHYKGERGTGSKTCGRSPSRASDFARREKGRINREKQWRTLIHA